jgi:hypothetical protein
MTNTLPLSCAVELRHWGLIRAQGADAASFLHGQLTQDVVHLTPDAARLAGYCSPKGRLLASFVIWRPQADEVLLACHAGVLPATLKRLSMFVMRAKCKLSDATPDFEWLGLAGEAATEAVSGLSPWARKESQGVSSIRLPDVLGVARAWRLSARGSGAEQHPASDAQAAEAWRWLEVQSALPLIEAATADQFVPQMLNFELTGAVNFQKGCYPGQEVVARSQYRSTAKRRTFLFGCGQPLEAGQEVFHSADPAQPAGMVVNAAGVPPSESGAGWQALIEVKLATLESGSLHLGSSDGALLNRLPMPYPVPIGEDEAGPAAS